jgi:hypothetical protein
MNDGAIQYSRCLKVAVIFLICAVLLISCASSALQTVEVTRIVPHTVVATQLVEVIVTATTNPAAETQIAPNSTTPLITWDTQQVLDAFLSAGLEVSNPRLMISDDYGLVPMLAVEGTRFFIPSICSDCGGRIMSFADEEKLVIVRDYYGQMGRFSAVLFSWVFVKDNILVQLNGQMPEADARRYEAALNYLR